MLVVLLLGSCVVAHAQNQMEGPDFSRGARPQGAFYLNGVGHQYLQGTNYTVVTAAVPVLNGKFFGIKVHVINRSKTSVNVLPEEVTAEDSVSAKSLVPYTATEVSEKMLRPSGMARMANAIGGAAPMMPPAGTGGIPTVADLVREMVKEAGADGLAEYMEASYPTLTPRGAARAMGKESAACDLGCELRNREIGDGNGPQLARRGARPDQIEQSEFLANTVPPEGEAVGVLYFAMPKVTDKAPISHNGRKSYRVTVTVPVGEEKFQFVFPPE